MRLAMKISASNRQPFPAILFCLFAVVMAGCATRPAPAPLKPAEVIHPPLRVGVTPNYPPLIYKAGKELAGLEPVFARMLGEALDREVRFVELKWDDQIPALEKGNIDIIMSGLPVTKLRAHLIAFTEPYLLTGQLMLIRAQDFQRFKVPQVIVYSRVKIGVEQATSGDIFVSNRCLQAERVAFKSTPKGVTALKGGNIDVFIHDAPMIWRLAAEHEADGLMVVNSPLTQDYLAWAVRKNDREFLADINRVRQQWLESGELQNLLLDWIPALGE
jgi:ABC-type amino acid transport substrate-binding protein